MSKNSIFRKIYFYYSLVLFITALVAVFYTLNRTGISSSASFTTVLFFLSLSLYTIALGYPHPNFGHVSFDRVGQLATMLVLGPVAGAIIAGIASFIYPVHRLWKGVTKQEALIASLHNAGLMSLMVLGGGLAYLWLGGTVPLTNFDLPVLVKLALVMIAMQLINEVGMFIYMLTRKRNPMQVINGFNTIIEITAGFVGVLVALVFGRLDVGTFALLLIVLSMGMFALQRFALMRNRLELLVEERTAELRLKTKELERKATHDKLTGLFNRRYADEYLEREIEAAIRYHQNFTISLGDIDHFKQINDLYSHEIGDVVLKRVAKELAENCRSSDVIARYGGEEFIFCFPHTNANDARAVCEKLRQALEAIDWSDTADDIHVTMSFGVAQIDANSRRKSILREADKHLYAAKHLGRNRVVA